MIHSNKKTGLNILGPSFYIEISITPLPNSQARYILLEYL